MAPHITSYFIHSQHFCFKRDDVVENKSCFSQGKKILHVSEREELLINIQNLEDYLFLKWVKVEVFCFEKSSEKLFNRRFSQGKITIKIQIFQRKKTDKFFH